MYIMLIFMFYLFFDYIKISFQ